MGKSHRRPNGEWTDDAVLAMDEWNELAVPFEKLGFTIIGYDPGILMNDTKTGGGPFTIPSYAAIRIANAINGDENNDN